MNICNFFLALIFSNAAFCAEKPDLDPKPFKGNWTESFPTTTPLGDVIHTPNYVKYGWIHSGEGMHIGKGCNFNGHIFQETLDLQTNSTRAEFVDVLIKR